MEVDEIQEFTASQLARLPFSEILTKRHLLTDTVNQLYDWSSCGFHRFTALITTTSFISFQMLKKSLAVMILVVD
jgi:hypothetical protein